MLVFWRFSEISCQIYGFFHDEQRSSRVAVSSQTVAIQDIIQQDRLLPLDNEKKVNYCNWFNHNLNNDNLLDIIFFADEPFWFVAFMW